MEIVHDFYIIIVRFSLEKKHKYTHHYKVSINQSLQFKIMVKVTNKLAYHTNVIVLIVQNFKSYRWFAYRNYMTQDQGWFKLPPNGVCVGGGIR